MVLYRESRRPCSFCHVPACPIPAVIQRGWAVGGRCTRTGDVGQRGLLEVVIAGSPAEGKRVLGTDVEPGSVGETGTGTSIGVEHGERGDGRHLVDDVKPAAFCQGETLAVAVPA